MFGVKQHPLTDRLMGQTPELMVSALTMLILLYFLLAYDGVFLGKLIKLMPTLSDKKRAVSIAQEIEAQVSRYLFTVTIINCCLGLAVGATVGFLGLPNPLMWGAMVAVLNFIPYLGALTGIICMTLGAALSFDSVGYALLFPLSYFVLAALEVIRGSALLGRRGARGRLRLGRLVGGVLRWPRLAHQSLLELLVGLHVVDLAGRRLRAERERDAASARVA